MEPRYIVAIEIGSSKIKGAAALLEADGTLSVKAVEEEKLIDAVRYGCVQNVGRVADKIPSIILKLENQISPAKIRKIYLGVGGRSLVSYSREVERQLPDLMEITPRIVGELKAQAENLPIDRHVVAVEPCEFIVDNTSVADPVGSYGMEIRATLNVLACKPQIIKNLNLVFSEKLPQFMIAGYPVRQIAEANLVVTSDERRLGCMLVDFGAETTTVSIYKSGALQYLATIPLGSRNITRDITSLSYLEERAEDLKKAVGNANPDNSESIGAFEGIDASEINAYIQARAGEIVANITEQISYAGLQPSDLPGGIIIVGGGARLKGFNELLANESGMKVRHGLPTAANVRISSSRIMPAESVDVIALLLEASQDSPVNCAEIPAPVMASHQYDNDSTGDSGEIRIGREETLDEDDDDDIIPEKPRKNRWGSLGARLRGHFEKLIDPTDDTDLDEDE